MTKEVEEVSPPVVPWFPTKITDLDFIGFDYLRLGDGIEHVDKPSFTDKEYRKRREYISEISKDFRIADNKPIPVLEYLDTEIKTWQTIYPQIKECLLKHAVDESLEVLLDMEKNVEGYGPETIPQLEPLSAYLQSKTGWRLKPAGGL